MSDLLIKLWQNGILQLGIWETIYMTLISTFFAYLIGLPVGLILRMTDRDGIHPIGWLNRTLGIIVNALRSIPFIILMVAMLPVAKFIVGTSLGNRAVIVTLVIAAAPYVARMVESAAKEVDAGVIEAALSMGASTFRIIWKVIIPEAKPALITGGVISTVTILGYSAMAGTIGGGGLGQIAITYGYQKYDDQIVWLCVALTIHHRADPAGVRHVHRPPHRPARPHLTGGAAHASALSRAAAREHPARTNVSAAELHTLTSETTQIPKKYNIKEKLKMKKITSLILALVLTFSLVVAERLRRQDH